MRRAPRCSRIVSTTTRYSLASSRARSGRRRVLDGLDLDVQRTFVADGTAAHVGAAHATDHERERPVGQLARVLDLGDGSDLREHFADLGHQHEAAPGLLGCGTGALRLIGLERDRDDHLREHDTLGERQQRQQLGAGSGFGEILLVHVLFGHFVPSRSLGTIRVTPLQRRGSRTRFPTREVVLT